MISKYGNMIIPPALNDDEIAQRLRALRGQMSILQMERLSGVNRQVLYRIMGGTPINRSPYELVCKVIALLNQYDAVPAEAQPATAATRPMASPVPQSMGEPVTIYSEDIKLTL